MYEGISFAQEYGKSVRRKRGRRRRTWRAVCAVVMVVCISGMTLILSDKVMAAPEEMLTEVQGQEFWEEEQEAQELGGQELWEAERNGQELREQEQQVGKSQEPAMLVEETASEGEEVLEVVEKEPGVPSVIIDAGHGGADDGCSRKGILEKDINLAIAKKVQSKLEELGYQVIMIREDDTYIAKEDRVKYANACQADIYVSIHQNASEDVNASGMEVWYKGDDEQRDNKRLAQLIQQQTVKSTGALERELKGDADFHVTGSTSMPACLIETGFLSNAGERKLLLTEEYQEQIASGITQGIDYYFHPKTMYLTFDDGPSVENTGRVLDVLKERNIKATFFLVGENVEKHPEMAKRIVEEGHTIGIHCNNHDYDTIYASVDNYIEDFEKARQTILEVTGVEVNIFRFPGGSVNNHNKKVRKKIIKEMTERGYIYYDWNASLEDAVRQAEPEELVAAGVETTLGRKKVVMLAHDVVYNTGICLEDLLDSLPEYQMLPLTEEVEPIQF